MDVLKNYEEQSGQLINKEKSFFYMYHKVAHTHIKEVEDCTGLSKGKFPLMCLGCPIGHARKKKVHFTELMKKVQGKL